MQGYCRGIPLQRPSAGVLQGYTPAAGSYLVISDQVGARFAQCNEFEFDIESLEFLNLTVHCTCA